MTTRIIKKNNSTYLIVLLLTTLTLISCSKDWLDAKADKSAIVPESLADFQGLLDDVAKMNQQTPVGNVIAADNYYITDGTFASTTKSFQTDIYRWAKKEYHTAVVDWEKAYQKILIDNIILEGLPKISVEDHASRQQWNDIKGQALFNRANAFFSLLLTFAPPYDNTSGDLDLGIPLRTSTDLNEPTVRSTVKEGYHLVIQDLKEAASLLPSKAKILTRPSSAAAYALLSRIYLSIGDYNGCLSAANACLEIYSTLLEFKNIPPNNRNIGRYNPEVLYHSNYSPGLLRSALIETQLFDSYSEDDLRKTRFFTQNPTTGSITFKGNYESVSIVYFSGLATDEVYLNKAECLARLGNTIEAMSTLNTLIKTRWSDTVLYPHLTASNAEEALMTILEERKKELIFRGTRWTDLRRLNKDQRFATTLTRTIEGITYTLEPNSLRYTLPIPDNIIDATHIQQNPGWDK